MTEEEMRNFYKNNCKNNIQRINLFHIEYNNYNGFIFTILEIDCSKWKNSHDLFNLSISKYYFIIEILFIKMTLYDMNKLELAKNPNTTIETLSKLAKDDDCDVRIRAARNPNTPAETLAELAKDENWIVRSYAAINPKISAEALDELAKDEDYVVRIYAARNPNTPKKQ